jgi:hypothetical protein
MNTTIFDIDHTAACRAEGWRMSDKFSRSQKDRIYGCLLFGGSMTAQEIVDDTGFKMSSVNARLNELLAEVRVKKSGKKLNLLTNVHNATWSVA